MSAADTRRAPDAAHGVREDRAAVLAARAGDAARIRSLTLDPDVIALRVERIRAQVDACAWTAIGLGLAFTAVNVQTFAAAGAPAGSPGWLVAWLLDPMVSLLLIGVLRAEQITARWQIATGWRVRAAKWGCFAATYAMNTWAAWTTGVPSGVVLHSVPPLVVLLGAEVAPELRDRLTAAVHTAAQAAPTGPVAVAPGSLGTGPAQIGARPARKAGPGLAGEVTALARDPGQDRDLSTDPAPAASVPAAVPGPGQRGTPEAEGDDPGLGSEHARETETDAVPEAVSDAVPTVAGDVAGDVAEDDTDPRVRELVGLLADGEELTGARAAAVVGCSERQGRRLLAEARDILPVAPEGAVADRPVLHVIGGA